METITFYSYKGGVGRTLAMANIALYLSRFGLDVCLIDFDLEAPGLHYKLANFLGTKKIKKGMVNFINDFFMENNFNKDLSEFSIQLLPKSENQGRITLIPAGNINSANYWKKLANINWNDLMYGENNQGIPFFLEFKELIKEVIQPHFLLIDSRTGITEMSGLCTSLLPDKVVFLITNNQENIEGAQQIYHSIKRVERLPNQKPIEVIFALTRVPFPTNIEEENLIKRITNQFLKSINESKLITSSDYEEEICVLHSERQLELSESILMSNESIIKETELKRDYLRLFSKIIPEKLIKPKVKSIVDEITNSANLLDDPDKIQIELESIVESYPHQKSIESLINFYFLRNENPLRILRLFDRLWDTYQIENIDMLKKYIQLVLKLTRYKFKKERIKINFNIIDKYIDKKPKIEIPILQKLAEIYKESGRYDRALEINYNLIDFSENKNDIIHEILENYRFSKKVDEAQKFLDNFSDDIESDVQLLTDKVRLLFSLKDYSEVKKIIEFNKEVNSFLKSNYSTTYLHILSELNYRKRLKEILDEKFFNAVNKRSIGNLISIGKQYIKYNFREDFLGKVMSLPEKNYILRELEGVINKRGAASLDRYT